jgi:hypothetical protein
MEGEKQIAEAACALVEALARHKLNARKGVHIAPAGANYTLCINLNLCTAVLRPEAVYQSQTASIAH